MNKTQGVELEIRKDDGNTILVVQKQGSTPFSVGQRVAIAGSGSQVTVSPREPPLRCGPLRRIVIFSRGYSTVIDSY